MIAIDGIGKNPLSVATNGFFINVEIIVIPINSTEGAMSENGKTSYVIVINIDINGKIERRYFKIPMFKYLTKVVTELEKAMVNEMKILCEINSLSFKDNINIKTIWRN